MNIEISPDIVSFLNGESDGYGRTGFFWFNLIDVLVFWGMSVLLGKLTSTSKFTCKFLPGHYCVDLGLN